MNRYATMAKTHWQQAFPQEYSQIENPQEFFTTLGQEVADEIADLEAELASQQSSPSLLENLSLRRTARSQAEEIVLAQRVWRTQELDETDEQSTTSTPHGWTPLVQDPADPWWNQQEHDER